MAKLSILYEKIGEYLEMHGDKDVTSISTWCGSAPIEYTLNLHDVYEGRVGGNPYAGEDKIDIPRSEKKKTMTKSRAMELLNGIINHISVAVSTRNVIEGLLSIGFTKEELVEEFGYSSSDVEYVLEDMSDE